MRLGFVAKASRTLAPNQAAGKKIKILNRIKSNTKQLHQVGVFDLLHDGGFLEKLLHLHGVLLSRKNDVGSIQFIALASK